MRMDTAGWLLLVVGIVLVGEAIIGTVSPWAVPPAVASAAAGGVRLKRQRH